MKTYKTYEDRQLELLDRLYNQAHSRADNYDGDYPDLGIHARSCLAH